MDLTTAVVTVLVALLGGGGIWGYLAAKNEREARESSQIAKLSENIEGLSSNIEELRVDVSSIKEELASTKDLSLANARDKLNFLCEKYLEKGEIPHREAVAFKLLGEAYIEAGGNSEVAVKYEYVIDKLPKKDKEV